MLLPSIFGNDLFSEWPSMSKEIDKAFYGRSGAGLMKTDVKETDSAYELAIDLPGYDKKNITAEIKDGYLTVQANQSGEKSEKEDGVYLRRERFAGSVSRSFYVGEDLTEEDIKAKFENGILRIDVPKLTPEKIEEKRRYIPIAG